MPTNSFYVIRFCKMGLKSTFYVANEIVWHKFNWIYVIRFFNMSKSKWIYVIRLINTSKFNWIYAIRFFKMGKSNWIYVIRLIDTSKSEWFYMYFDICDIQTVFWIDNGMITRVKERWGIREKCLTHLHHLHITAAYISRGTLVRNENDVSFVETDISAS